MHVYWEGICQDLDETSFAFCSWSGGLEELLMACLQMGFRMRKSVVFVDVTGSIWV